MVLAIVVLLVLLAISLFMLWIYYLIAKASFLMYFECTGVYPEPERLKEKAGKIIAERRHRK